MHAERRLFGGFCGNFLVFFLLSLQSVPAQAWIWGLRQESHVTKGYELYLDSIGDDYDYLR